MVDWNDLQSSELSVSKWQVVESHESVILFIRTETDRQKQTVRKFLSVSLMHLERLTILREILCLIQSPDRFIVN